MNRERKFQKCAENILKSGQSVLVVAPTGLGKTRAALAPFAASQHQNGLLGTRLIYALPLRALARGVEEECENLGIQAVIHHGDEPESQFFSEKAIITTIDQYLTAFAGAPLSWASHWSHAAAGAVLTSYSVFDEVHLLSPQKGLQLLFAMLYLRKRWGLLSCVMTATLPPSVVEFFRRFCGIVEIKATDADVKERDSWRKVCLKLVGATSDGSFKWDEKNEEQLAEFVKGKWDSEKWGNLGKRKKIIVFVNTVDRALKVYEKLKELFRHQGQPKILLAHSRFTKEDRRTVEDKLQALFGKQAGPDPAILVTTQVAEAGLNISAPLVITELCPMDALIQRAGRCQRFKADTNLKEVVGKVFVIKPSGDNWFAPYYDTVRLVAVTENSSGKKKRNPSKQLRAIELTRVVLEKEAKNGLLLDWKREQELIQKALDRLYQAYLSGTADVEFRKGQQGEKLLEELFKMYSQKKGKEKESTEEESETEEE